MTVPLLAAYALSSWRGSVQRFRLSSMLRASQKTCLQMHRPRGGIDLDPRALHGFLQQQWYAEFASDEDFSDDDGHATDADDLDVAAALPGGAGGADAAAALPGGAGGADAAAAAPGGVGGAHISWQSCVASPHDHHGVAGVLLVAEDQGRLRYTRCRI